MATPDSAECPGSRVAPISEQGYDTPSYLSQLPLMLTASGCYAGTGPHRAKRELENDAIAGPVAEALRPVDRQIFALLANGETSRRRIELTLVRDHGLSHRRARQVVDALGQRLTDNA